MIGDRRYRRNAAMGEATQIFARLACRVSDWAEGRELITWEQRCREPDVLTITNAWPHEDRPAYGPFVRRSVEGLEAVGLRTDVLFIRGYGGKVSYLCAALLVVLLRATPSSYALVHAHGGETALAARMFVGGPVVSSYLGSDLLAPYEGGGLRERISCVARRLILRRHASLMTATTTKTHEMESVLSRRAQARNRVIPDGVNLRHFVPIERDEAREYLGWSSRSRIVLFAGRAEAPGKRLWLAEQAVAIARSDLPDLRLEVVSGVDPENMPYYYSAADCLVHTSASEGSPNVIKEALACDLPIIATPAGDIAQLVRGARPGGVVPPHAGTLAQEIVRCCRTPERSNGRSLATGMDAGTAARATLDLYSSVDHALGERVRARREAT
jgi:glycosyltransferase involved in cell wall biosynthesis